MLLSKQEIKDTLNPSVLFAIQRKVCLYARVAVEELLKYTEKLEAENTALKKERKKRKQLEIEKQKLIEKLEEIINECIKNIEEDERHDEWGYKHYKIQTIKEILKILKGEKE